MWPISWQVELHLRVGTGRAERQQHLVVGHDEHRVHRVAHALARLQAVGVVRVEVPVGHAVVEQDTGLARDHAGAEARTGRLQLADGVALAVHHREAGGVLAALGWSGREPVGVVAGATPAGSYRQASPAATLVAARCGSMEARRAAA